MGRSLDAVRDKTRDGSDPQLPREDDPLHPYRTALALRADKAKPSDAPTGESKDSTDAKPIKKPDGSTVRVKDGLVDSVENGSNSIKIEYKKENDKVVKDADGNPVIANVTMKINGQERRLDLLGADQELAKRLHISQTGDSIGNVTIADADFKKLKTITTDFAVVDKEVVTRDGKDYIQVTRRQDADGYTCEYKYDASGKRTHISETCHNLFGKTLSFECDLGKPRKDGKEVWDTYDPRNPKKKWRRTDINVDGDGRLTYKEARMGFDGSDSADVEEARDKLLGTLEGHMSPARMARMQQMMRYFEQRVLDERVEALGASGANVEQAREAAMKNVIGCYDTLAAMVAPTDAEAPGQYWNQQQRAFLAENFMFLAQDPGESNQGNHGTCWNNSGWICNLIQEGYNHPGDAANSLGGAHSLAQVLKQIALTGSYTTLNGGLNGGGPKTFRFSKAVFFDARYGGMNEEKYWTIDTRDQMTMVPGVPQTHGTIRSPVGMIFDQALPVIGGRREGRSTGGNFESDFRARYMDGRPVADGSQNINYMISGHRIQIEPEGIGDYKRQKKVLLERGGVCDSPPGHLRSRHLIKRDGQWYVTQDDQHGNQDDRVLYKVTDLRTWSTARAGRIAIHHSFGKVGDTTIGGNAAAKRGPDGRAINH